MSGAFPLLAFYGLTAVGLVLCLFLFVSVKAEIRAGGHRARKIEKELRAELDRLRAGNAELAGALKQVEEQSGTLVAPPPRTGLNLSHRSQVLRRHRLGEDAVRIAGALGLPRNEVDLLIKVNRIIIDQL